MKKSFARIKAEETGSVLILSLLILMVLTLLGITALNTSEFEYRIASNDKYRDMSFYNADSGVYAAAKLIGEAITTGAAPDYPGVVTYYTPFNALVMTNKGPDSTASRDLEINLAQGSVDIDIVSRSAQQIAGGGAEFGSGSGGAGVGSVGGIGIKYEVDAYGNGPANSRVVVGTRYVKILGAAGGL